MLHFLLFIKGIHSREWIAPAVTTYFIDQLTSNATQHKALLDNLDWYFLPVHNPDGYAFTWEHVRNKQHLWPYSKMQFFVQTYKIFAASI